MTRRFAAGLAGISSAFTALVALQGAASAQVTDFATCPATLPACSATVNDCCYQDFPDSGTDKAVIIPMDRCHQQIATSGNEGPPSNAAPAWCVNSSGSADEGMIQAYGLVYRLMQHGIHVYWLVNPTKYPPALTDNETPASSQTFITQDIDFWVLNPTTATPPTSGTLTGCAAGCTDPVRKLNSTTLAPVNDSYNAVAFPVRGSAFVIAASDRTRFNNFWKHTGEFAGFASDTRYNFSAVDLYELNSTSKIVYQRFDTTGPNYTLGGSGTSGAPVAIRIDYDAPRLARLAPAGVSNVWLSSAKLDDAASSPECLYGNFSPSTAVYCDVSEEDIQAGSLIFGRFDWAWIDNWSDNSPCGDAGEITQVDEARQFMMGIPGVRAGGNVMFMDAVIKVMESSSCGSRQPQGLLGTGILPSNVGPTEKYIIRYPQSTFTQWGDIPTTVASGSAVKWTYYNGTTALGYDTSHTAAGGSLVRLLTVDNTAVAGNPQCTQHRSGSVANCDRFSNAASSDVVDFTSYVRFQEDQRNGIAFYTGGNNVNGRTSHLRLILNALLSTPNGQGNPTAGTPTTREITRSSPIVATVNDVESLYQGSIEIVEPATPMTEYDDSDDDATFVFPYFKGHLRAVPVASGLSDTDDTDLADLDADWDLADDGNIPDATDAGCSTNFTGTCRTIFTTTDEPGGVDGLVQLPDRVYMETDNVDALKPFLGSDLTDAEAQTVITRIQDADLGGVDRSTVAVIEDTAQHDRPTMIYVGATDGMLHAVCAEQQDYCPAAGRELWAFMPRTQMPLVRENTTRIDGSPKVAEVYGDFYGTGAEFRTILTFQSGWGQPGMPDRAPSVIAIDISEPDDPQIVWEWTTRATRDDVELGVGLNLAMAPVRIGGETVQLTVAQTNNGGLGSAGFYVAGINTETGELVWEVQSKEYPSPQDASNNPVVPTTGIPQGAALVDRTGDGLYGTHVVVPSLYGDVWLLKAEDGTSEYVDPITLAEEPIFRFSEDFHPVGATPTVYADLSSGNLYAAFTSGGYIDQLSPLGIDKDWSPQTEEQFLIGVTLSPTETNLPMNETTAGTYGGERPIKVSLGNGERGFAQAIVTGDEIFVVSDSTDVNLSTYGSSPGTGAVRRYNLTDKAQVGNTEDITGGASSVEISGDKGNVVIGSGQDARRMDVQDTFGEEIGTGRTIEQTSAGTGTTRLLWLGG